MTIMRVGKTAVPYTVTWTSEERPFIGYCPYACARAICQPISPGIGKPIFAKPHSNRQREVIAIGACDLCGKPIKNQTKVSLSHARPHHAPAPGSVTGILQVEPLLHRACALESLKFCPQLRRDIDAGQLIVRQVNSHRVQFAIMGPQFIKHYVPDYIENRKDRIVGHAKVELIRWIDRDEAWLSRSSNKLEHSDDRRNKRR